MTFDDALKLLVSGHELRIKTWDKEHRLILEVNKIMKLEGKQSSLWVPTNEDVMSTEWQCANWGTYYDKGYDEGYKVGYDEALEKYLEALDQLNMGGDLKQIITALKRKENEIHKN